MSINLSWYDLTQLDWAADSADTGAIIQSTTNSWKPLTTSFQKAMFRINENRIEHRGNLQTLAIDQRVKRNLDIALEYIAYKYDAGAPAYGWWDLINQAFYGGATGAPATRPGCAFIAAKLNFGTPEYWTASGVKIQEVKISGSMVEGPMKVALKAMGRAYRLDTNNYVQGTATRRANATATPIVPSNDVTIKINNTDITSLVQDWTLTLSRGLAMRGRSATAADSSSQIGTDGRDYREFVPSTFDGKLELTLDPYGTTSAQILLQQADTALATCEIQAENTTNGKQIQFTAAKTKSADQSHTEGQAPSTISLIVDGSTFNVNTL